MPKEKILSQPENNLEVATLYSGTKVRFLLEAFDKAKGSPEEIQKRKDNFMELMRNYYYSVARSKAKGENMISASDEHRAKIHNQIMEIVRTISLSRDATPDQRKVADYLARDKKRVEEMITSYFSGYNSSDPAQHSELRQALRGEGLFTSPPGKEDD